MRRLLLSSFVALLAVTPAGAATTLQYGAANFTDAIGPGASDVVLLDTDGLAGAEQIRWGDSGPISAKSGLRFATAPAQTISQGAQFTLGTLTYFNNVISAGTQVTSVDLGISALLGIDGSPLAAGPFVFTINVDETPNSGPLQGCPYYSQIACSDQISIITGAASQTFELGGQTLTLYLDGFLDRNAVPRSSFIAQEEQSTTATLVGHFDLASAVPEPASWAMMVAGFGLLGGAMRRRERLVPIRLTLPPA
ncbi:THxN family PEP-CTERM protein [Sphingomonas sp.]|uniref:THxN family PEP-CTERM protein n=1 Tax=Sphingomonas sp. TaxID=28214 RepID=UPI000DAF8F3A|nr:THxN family PEP-CTERM protein [Sphingomonas sp.]PZU11448.1 MAG: hypothetical protein DI605_00130 [Sphingomonas sp.]